MAKKNKEIKEPIQTVQEATAVNPTPVEEPTVKTPEQPITEPEVTTNVTNDEPVKNEVEEYKLTVKVQFTDKYDGTKYKVGAKLTTAEKVRRDDLIRRGLAAEE